MKTIAVTDKKYKTDYMIISYKFKGFKNIVVSGGKIYQLPCQIGKRSFDIKEITKKGYYYWIESKPYSRKYLKSKMYKRKDQYLINIEQLHPF
jgi:hypothetical protein